MNYRAYAAEFLGTFLLALIVRFAIGSSFPVPTPVLAGLMVGTLVYILGTISGTHINPAVTATLAVLQKITLKDAGIYIVVQCLGALLAKFVADAALAPLTFTVGSGLTVASFEAVGAGMLMLGVASVVYGKTPSQAAGLTIGSSLILGAMLASVGAAGFLNPAVAIAADSVSAAYILGPIVGAVLAGLIYRDLQRA